MDSAACSFGDDLDRYWRLCPTLAGIPLSAGVWPPVGPWAVWEGDNRPLLAGIPDGAVDCIMTSPPYNLGASPSAYEHPGSARGQLLNWQGYQTDRDALPEVEYQALQIATLKDLHRVTAGGGSCYYVHKDRCWDGRSISPRTWLEHTPWMIRQQITWDRGSTHQMAGWYFDPTTEWIFWLTKGAPTCKPAALARWGSVWRIPPPQGVNRPDHVAPFPLSLAERCVLAGSSPGDLILDPWAGSGTTGEAALRTGRRALLLERQPRYVADMRRRLGRMQMPLLLLENVSCETLVVAP